MEKNIETTKMGCIGTSIGPLRIVHDMVEKTLNPKSLNPKP